MRSWIPPFAALLVALALASPATADVYRDTGWIDIPPYGVESFTYQGGHLELLSLSVTEEPAVQSGALKVVRFAAKIRNIADANLFFDVDLIAVDDEGKPLFVISTSPTLDVLPAGSTQTVREKRYVQSGTLVQANLYRLRIIGVAVD